MSELFDTVDALAASAPPLPPSAERKRLRAVHGLTLSQVAGALKVRRATVSGRESGKTEPRSRSARRTPGCWTCSRSSTPPRPPPPRPSRTR